MIFVVGERVCLPADADEEWVEEFGTVEVVEENGMYVVVVDEKYREKNDDGIREVSFVNMQKIN